MVKGYSATDLTPNTLICVVYNEMEVSTTHQNILDGITEFQKMGNKERQRIYKSVISSINAIKTKVVTGQITSEERQNLCDDIVLAVTAEYIMFGKEISLTKKL